LGKLSRKECLERWRKKIAQNKPILYAAVELGILGRWAEIGGADQVGFSVTGWKRLHGVHTHEAFLPIHDHNAIIMEWGWQLINAVKEIPVFASVFWGDHTRNMSVYLKQMKELGYLGAGQMPWFLNEQRNKTDYASMGITYDNDVEMLRQAREMDMLTRGYACTKDQMRALAKVPVDLLTAHIGLTVHPEGGPFGAKVEDGTLRETTLEAAAARIQELFDVAQNECPDGILMVHGGLASTPENVKYLLDHTDGHGFVGALIFDQTPLERAIKEAVEGFVNIKMAPKRKR
jgi:predicted TIM-barrel enzyme